MRDRGGDVCNAPNAFRTLQVSVPEQSVGQTSPPQRVNRSGTTRTFHLKMLVVPYNLKIVIES